MEHFPKLIDTKEDRTEKLETSLGTYAELGKNEIMENLRAKGVDDPEARDALKRWLDIQEKRAEEDPTNRRGILLEIARSDFYVAIGEIDDACDCLDAASVQAQGEGHFDLQDIAEERITLVLKARK